MARKGRPKKLTPDQVHMLRRRFSDYWWNRPKRLCAEFGIDRKTLTAYVYCKHKGQAK